MSGKVAVITGAANGIGRNLAITLARAGATVLGIDKDAEGLESLKCLHPDLIITYVCDLKDLDEEEARKIARMVPETPGVNYLVQNAAATPTIPFGDITRELTADTYATNVIAPLLLDQAFFDHLSNASGRVLHIGTNHAHRGVLGMTSYFLSKCAFYGMIRQLRLEFGGKSVSFASCIPGATNTKAFWTAHGEATKLNLPVYQFVQKFLDEGKKPREPIEVAGFLYWVLTETTPEEYESKEWDIHDTSITELWQSSIAW